ncbi:sensor histidine kinase [Glycomyces buryatensis]|uniref:histidine kinase n=1 Tax=Glycomyces buryatensis TaxID=2570927 RepID=A0A4V4HRA8_9ACTN|nr:ATP-binding protein [Glycomyces buryatensis]THV37076.1 HAMP domain-containing protein [Glycomyces buryatensis]
MTIRTKMAAAMAILLIVAVAIIGLVTVQIVSDKLTGQVDEQITRIADPQNLDAWVQNAQHFEDDSEQAMPSPFQEYSLMVFNSDGELSFKQQAGSPDDYDPLPAIASSPATDEYFNVKATDGSITYRALAREYEVKLSSGETPTYTFVVATPLTEVHESIATLTKTVVFTGIAVAFMGISAALVITRRGLRPVDHMVADAEYVAAGNLAHRITPADPRTEMGRLSLALNRMVSRLAEAIGARDRQHERLRQFVADAGHELRTPLTAIGGYVQLYQSGVAAEGEKLDRAMDRIGSENARLAKLVDDLMVLSRLDEEVGGDRELVELSQLARDAVDDSEVADPDHPVELVAAGEATVVANEGQLRQVLVNLLTNARVHTPAGTRIDVSVVTENTWAVIRIADQGPGIPEEHRQKVFDRFYRADPSRSRATGGSGLGLSIVTSIVARHGGELRLYSSEGEGTTVEVRIPKAQLE